MFRSIRLNERRSIPKNRWPLILRIRSTGTGARRRRSGSIFRLAALTAESCLMTKRSRGLNLATVERSKQVFPGPLSVCGAGTDIRMKPICRRRAREIRICHRILAG